MTISETGIATRLKQAREEALEEAAREVNQCKRRYVMGGFGHADPDEILAALEYDIRALKEKQS